MSGAVAGIALLCAAGWLPAVAVLGVGLATVFMSLLVAAELAAISGVLTVALAGTPLPWFAALALAANAWALLALRSRDAVEPGRPGAAPLVGTLVGLAAAMSPRVGYDAHAIWLLHSRLLVAGHRDYVRSLGMDALLFANPDYPPAASASVAVAWQVTGVDTRSGQLLTAVLTAAAVGLLACGVSGLVRSAPPVVRAAVGVLLPVAAFGIAGGSGTVGYVDLLWSAAVTAGAVWGLLAERTPSNALVALLACAVGGSTKQEGLVLAAVLVGLIAVRHRASLRGLRWPLLAAAAAIGAWPAVVRVRGGGSELAERGDLGELLRGDPDVWSRLRPSATALAGEVELIALAGGLCAAAGLIAFTDRRRRLRIGSSGWLWTLAAVHAVALLTAYVVSGYDLAYHLSHSLTRTTIVLELLLVVDASVWLLIAGAELRTWASPESARRVLPGVRPSE